METEKAGTLKLCAVNRQAMLDIILEMGGLEAVTQGKFDATNYRTVAASNRALTYCLGWGVTNDPPPAALELLEALGKPTHLPQIARANWLRYLALSDTEVQDVVARVMRMTFEVEDGGN